MVPNFLTRYHTANVDPFVSLNDYPHEKANEIKLSHCHRNNIGGYYAQEEYLLHRKRVEKWIYSQLIKRGGNPKCNVPIYMALGESPKGEFDIRHDIQKDAIEFQIPVSYLDMKAVTFTYPDSLINSTYNKHGDRVNAQLTNEPGVYLYHELEELIRKYHVYDEPYEHYIEAQVWDREMLYAFLRSRS